MSGGAEAFERSGDMRGPSGLDQSDHWRFRGLPGNTLYTHIHARRCEHKPCRDHHKQWKTRLPRYSELQSNSRMFLEIHIVPLCFFSLFHPFWLPPSLVTFLDRPIFQASDIGDYK